MEQHATPQNVTSYQFRLIGDMTVKQFVELAGGILLAWFFATRNVPVIFKWPLAISSAILGAAMAFVPIEERPLDVWIKNFFLSLWKPTLFLWHKKPVSTNYAAVIKKPQKNNNQKLDKTSKQKLDAYLQSINKASTNSILDQTEEKKLTTVENLLFSINKVNKPIIKASLAALAPTTPSIPQSNNDTPGVRVRKLRPAKDLKNQKIVFQQTNKIKAKKTNKPFVLKTVKEIKASDKNPPTVVQAAPLAPPFKVKSLYPETNRKSIRAEYMQALQMPIKPTQPNVLTGMVVDPYSKAIPNAIVEIKNKNNETVRALKSNKLGQFFSAYPLKNNQYQLHLEHADYDFDIINLELVGKIIQPLKILGKRKVVN